MNNTTKFTLKTDYELVNFDGQLMFLPISTGAIANKSLFSLEGIGGDVISTIECGMSFGEIIDLMTKKYTENSQVIYRDITDFINALLANDIISIVEE